MLYNTFVHIPGIGETTERRLWQAGVTTWDKFVAPYPEFLTAQKVRLITDHLVLSRAQAGQQTPLECLRQLPAAQRWRIFPHYRDSVAYLDIETTGLSFTDHCITTVSLYDGKEVFTYVQGENLADFAEDIQRYQMLVTYNGKAFDIPMLERHFGFKLAQAHIDLRPLLQGLGFVGGLKGCEKQMGLDRGELAGVDGYFAVLLWREYRRTKSRRVLDTLLAYNVEDTVNLESLLVQAYNLKLQGTPFAESHHLPQPTLPEKTFLPDLELIGRLRGY
ncbi:ribonuclease H-like domain-containing protein [Thiovibrio frasassiensis]|uniref:Ribonuclease H-like domain-containing protein n=1 Tax=Thiovibrio frasassiensis TaxID=2984131 RepID=A0A9X4MEY9_9BACT|nr:ribonuclease H-like domain-containing protein [Thiovibrio frasassiensis]MDG4475061.1 ribonuclease H-like domain-containing protein [Thiovibrio frasassiensis]